MAPIAKDNDPDSSESGSEASERTVIMTRSKAVQQPVVDLNHPENYATNRPLRTTRNQNPVYRDIPNLEYNKQTYISKPKKKGPGPKPKKLTPRRQNIITNFLKALVAQPGKQGFVRAQWRVELMRRLRELLGRGGTVLFPVTKFDLSYWLNDKKFAEILKKLEQGGASTAPYQNEDTSADSQPGPSAGVSVFRPAPAPGDSSSKKRKAPQEEEDDYKQIARRLTNQPQVQIEPLDLTKYKSKGKNGVTLRGPAPANLTSRQEEGRAPVPVQPLPDIQEDPGNIEDDQYQAEPEVPSQDPSGLEQQQQEDRATVDNQEDVDNEVVVVASSSESSSSSSFAAASTSSLVVHHPAPVVPAPLGSLGRPEIIRNPLSRDPPAPVVQNDGQRTAMKQLRYNAGQMVRIYNGFIENGYPEGMNSELVQHLLNAVVAALYDHRFN